MDIAVEEFDWDKGNVIKCQKHGVTLQEIEEFFQTQLHVAPDIKHSQEEERFFDRRSLSHWETNVCSFYPSQQSSSANISSLYAREGGKTV